MKAIPFIVVLGWPLMIVGGVNFGVWLCLHGFKVLGVLMLIGSCTLYIPLVCTAIAANIYDFFWGDVARAALTPAQEGKS